MATKSSIIMDCNIFQCGPERLLFNATIKVIIVLDYKVLKFTISN